MQSNKNSFLNILFNIFIPVMILNKGSKYGLTASSALLIALAFPITYGIYSAVKEKSFNYISLLGLLNVLFSGVLTLLALGGIWFAVKEAAFPLLIGVFVFASSMTTSPFFETLFLNPAAFDIQNMESKLDSAEKKIQFKGIMKTSTQFLSLSFLVSAILNFTLAMYIFKPLADTLSEAEKQELLNQQFGQMMLYSMGVILVPMIAFIGFILFYAFKKTSQLTGLKIDEMLLKN